jgi:hypothetical protein
MLLFVLKESCVCPVAIFHEGSKYWACCKKGCLEFEEMLQQPGCTTGKVESKEKKRPPSSFVFSQETKKHSTNLSRMKSFLVRLFIVARRAIKVLPTCVSTCLQKVLTRREAKSSFPQTLSKLIFT